MKIKILLDKKLMGIILGLNIISSEYEKHPKQHGNNINFTTNSRGVANEEDFINIYELMSKCKEWVWEEYNYTIESHMFKQKDGSLSSFAEVNDWKNANETIIEVFPYPEPEITEYESVFKACHKILVYKKGRK